MLIKVAVLVALAAPGFIMRKLRMLPDGTSKGLGNILLYVGIPFLILENFQGAEYSYDILRGILMAFALSVISHCLIIFAGKLVFYKDPAEAKKRAAIVCSVFSNCGFLGIPILLLMLPDMPEAVIYAVIYNAVFDYILFTYGVYELSGDRKFVQMKKAVLNPITIVLVIALPLFFASVDLGEAAPEIMDAVGMLGGLCTPVSMFIMGINLAEMSLKDIFVNWRMYAVAALKLIAAPLLMFGLVMLVDLVYPISHTLKASMVIMAAMPTAAATIAFQENYRPDSMDCSAHVLGTTLFSVVLIPVLAILVNLIP